MLSLRRGFGEMPQKQSKRDALVEVDGEEGGVEDVAGDAPRSKTVRVGDEATTTQRKV